MSDPAAAFTAAQAAALLASAELKTAMGLDRVRLYVGVVPERASLPYLRTGDDLVEGIGVEDECLSGSDISSTVHIWAKPDVSKEGVSQARVIGGRVREVMLSLTLEGHDVLVSEFVSASYFTDPDGSTHGILSFRHQTEPVSA